MADVVIRGTTPGPCGCCGSSTPTCSYVCQSDTEACCTELFPDCLGIRDDAPCFSVWAEFPCVGPGTGETIINCAVQGIGSNLTVGRYYRLRIKVCRVDDCEGITANIDFFFQAIATSQVTGYTGIPSPSAINEPGWMVTGCEICETVGMFGPCK